MSIAYSSKELLVPGVRLVQNPALHSMAIRNNLSVLFLSICEGRSGDCAHDRSPPSIKL
jgi:hypothetical protein